LFTNLGEIVESIPIHLTFSTNDRNSLFPLFICNDCKLMIDSGNTQGVYIRYIVYYLSFYFKWEF
jgi:hypothetical protein